MKQAYKDMVWTLVGAIVGSAGLLAPAAFFAVGAATENVGLAIFLSFVTWGVMLGILDRIERIAKLEAAARIEGIETPVNISIIDNNGNWIAWAKAHGEGWQE